MDIKNSIGDVIEDPHCPQNLAPGLSSAPQLVQIIRNKHISEK